MPGDSHTAATIFFSSLSLVRFCDCHSMLVFFNANSFLADECRRGTRFSLSQSLTLQCFYGFCYIAYKTCIECVVYDICTILDECFSRLSCCSEPKLYACNGHLSDSLTRYICFREKRECSTSFYVIHALSMYVCIYVWRVCWVANVQLVLFTFCCNYLSQMENDTLRQTLTHTHTRIRKTQVRWKAKSSNIIWPSAAKAIYKTNFNIAF